jgi:hypothetical protein
MTTYTTTVGDETVEVSLLTSRTGMSYIMFGVTVIPVNTTEYVDGVLKLTTPEGVYELKDLSNAKPGKQKNRTAIVSARARSSAGIKAP